VDPLTLPDLAQRLDSADDLADIFEVVKRIVRAQIKQSRGGLMLGLADLGNQPGGFFGGFFYVGSNVIVMNRIPLERIKQTRPELYKPYAFHVLLHEYLHTLGYLDEGHVRSLAAEISEQVFGDEHLATQVARNIRKFFPNISFPGIGWQPKKLQLEMVEGFDRGSVTYIS